MTDVGSDILDEAIRYERNVSRLYYGFHETFPEDSDFWFGLSAEEEVHASLLEAGRTLFGAEFTEGLDPERVDALTQSNRKLEEVIEEFEKGSFTREKAFRSALQIEQEGEEHILQSSMAPAAEPKGLEILDEIERQDLEHVNKIRVYMREHGTQA